MRHVLVWFVSVALIVTAGIAGMYDVARTVACISDADVTPSASPTLRPEPLRGGCDTAPTAGVVMDSPWITEC